MPTGRYPLLQAYGLCHPLALQLPRVSFLLCWQQLFHTSPLPYVHSSQARPTHPTSWSTCCLTSLHPSSQQSQWPPVPLCTQRPLSCCRLVHPFAALMLWTPSRNPLLLTAPAPFWHFPLLINCPPLDSVHGPALTFPQPPDPPATLSGQTLFSTLHPLHNLFLSLVCLLHWPMCPGSVCSSVCSQFLELILGSCAC